jgi:ribose 5-phosphate isomerase B
MAALLRIAIGSDRAGASLRLALTADLAGSPLVAGVVQIGDDAQHLPYPQVAFAAAQLVAEGLADRAVLICHTGLGMAITANKVPGIRAAACHDPYSVEHAVTHNDAQVLCLGQALVTPEQAQHLVRFWLTRSFDPTGRAGEKLALITAWEQRR